MERRKFVIGAGALATGSAAALGTGAFSSVEADRDIKLETVADSGAFLALNANPEYDDSGVVDDSGGTLGLNFSQLNVEAYTEFADLFRISNNGSRRARVWIDISEVPDDANMTIFSVEDGTYGGLGPSLGVDGGPESLDMGQGVFLDPGTTVKVSPAFGAYDGDISNIDQDTTITVYAVTEDSEIVGEDLFNDPANNANQNFEQDVNPNLIEDANNPGGYD